MIHKNNKIQVQIELQRGKKKSTIRSDLHKVMRFFVFKMSYEKSL